MLKIITQDKDITQDKSLQQRTAWSKLFVMGRGRRSCQRLSLLTPGRGCEDSALLHALLHPPVRTRVCLQGSPAVLEARNGEQALCEQFSASVWVPLLMSHWKAIYLLGEELKRTAAFQEKTKMSCDIWMEALFCSLKLYLIHMYKNPKQYNNVFLFTHNIHSDL